MLKKISDCFAGIPMTIVAGIFLVLSLILMVSGIKWAIDPAWVTVVLSGYPLLYLAITRLICQRWISSALLISIAMVASLAIGELFAAGEVAFIMAIGAILEDLTVARARKGLSKLIAMRPAQGRRLRQRNGVWEEECIPAAQIQTGDLLRVFPGEAIPADGTIVAGETSVDQSIMTGESLPVDRGVGDPVFCGTINRFGSIDLEATAVGEDSSLQKLIRMVQEADEKKAPMQRIADQWSVWLVPIALLIAAGAFVVNWATGMDVMAALNRGVTVLVVFCPCALALATPTSIMAAIGQATKRGVLIKSGEALEAMGKVDTITFDKTGTLTCGKLEVSDILPASEDITPRELLTLVAAAEARSEHPLGKAVTAQALALGLSLPEASAFQMEAGRGIRAVVQGRELLCGNEAFLSRQGVSWGPEAAAQLDELRGQGKALILAAEDGVYRGAIALSDVLRPEAAEMVQGLREMGVRAVLLTGDNQRAAGHFAAQAGIGEVCAQLLPEEKVQAVENLQAAGRRVCMVGDGVNDAPALKTASVGIAMGHMGSDIAVEAADIALVGDDLSKLPYLKRLARATLRTIKGNIAASMCINAVAVTLSVMGLLTPVTGALVHNAGSVLVVLHAALLYDRNFDTPRKPCRPAGPPPEPASRG